MNRHARSLAEALATVLYALMAGFFFAFSVAVAPGLARAELGTAIGVFQEINVVVRNAVFGVAYLGPAVLPVPLLAGTWREAASMRWRLWALAWIVYLAGVQAPTSLINVPINREVAAWTATAGMAAWPAVLERWTDSNFLRTVASVAALCLSVVASRMAIPQDQRMRA